MKKVFLTIILTLSVITASAQSSSYKSWKAPADEPDLIRCSAIAYGGYNFLENQPLGGIAVGLNCFFIRAEIDFGVSVLEMPPPISSTSLDKGSKNLFYLSPNIGISFGDKYEFYTMIGFSTWGIIATTEATECSKDKFNKDQVYARFKVGSNIMISNKFFINADLSYLLPKNSNGYIYFKNLALRVGIGYRF